MSGIGADWIAFFVFLIMIALAVVLEIFWLIRKGWATAGRATGYVLSTDLLGIGIGGGVAGACFLIIFMMVMGPTGRGGTSPDWAYVVVTILAILLPMLVLFFLKRLGFVVFGIGEGRRMWVYSLVGAVLIPSVVLTPPTALFWLIVSIR